MGKNAQRQAQKDLMRSQVDRAQTGIMGRDRVSRVDRKSPGAPRRSGGAAAALLGLAVAAAAFGLSGDPFDDGAWSRAGGSGMTVFVAVDPAAMADRRSYDAAIDALCRPDQYCYVMFWSERSAIPNRLPMTPSARAALLASYSRNPATGYDRFLWNCGPIDSREPCATH